MAEIAISLSDTVPASFGGKAAALSRVFHTARVPDGIALSPAYDPFDPLPEWVELWITRYKSSLMVRSSALGEDGERLSFAGVFDSVSGVAPIVSRIRRAIRKVKVSASSVRALEYSPGQVKMGVIVQRMVQATWSAVIFTGKEAFIEVSPGHGERLVQGESPHVTTILLEQQEPTMYRILEVVGEPLDMKIMATLQEALFLATQCEKRLKHRVDCELAFDGNVWWTVQARPITA